MRISMIVYVKLSFGPFCGGQIIVAALIEVGGPQLWGALFPKWEMLNCIRAKSMI